jgi:hypothetical protein
MRGLVTASLAVLALLPATSGTARPTAAPALRVTETSPFLVRGAGFKPLETVRVVAQVEGRHVKTVRATANGAFVARFSRVSLKGCAGYIVRATGSKGSHAYRRHVPECPED